MFKYFLYISDSKVDMMLAQIAPEHRKKIAYELKIDLKLLSATRKTERELGADRIQKLNLVVSYLNEFGDLGSIDEPGEFFDGRLAMKWGPYSDDMIAAQSDPLVYFGGTTDTTILGLGGSSRHLIGNVGDSSPHSHSAMPYMIKFLQAQLSASQALNATTCDSDSNDDPALVATHLATTGMKGSEQVLEFVAKRLKWGSSPFPHRDRQANMKVLLGSPLYVALAE